MMHFFFSLGQPKRNDSFEAARVGPSLTVAVVQHITQLVTRAGRKAVWSFSLCNVGVLAALYKCVVIVIIINTRAVRNAYNQTQTR